MIKQETYIKDFDPMYECPVCEAPLQLLLDNTGYDYAPAYFEYLYCKTCGYRED